jgi:hypothetical protein
VHPVAAAPCAFAFAKVVILYEAVDRTRCRNLYVSLVDIVEAMEGPIAVTDCVDGAQDPRAVSNCCFMSSHGNHVNLAIRNALNEVSLEDLTDPVQLFPLPVSPSITEDDRQFSRQ